jgi:ketosteroid isomerase-like protein
MSQENVEIVRRAYDAWGRRDTDALQGMAEHFAPDFVFESVVTGQVYTGTERLWDFAADVSETLGDYVPEVEEIIDAGEQVVVVLRVSGRAGRSGVPVSQHTAIVLTFEHRRIARGRSFTSRAAALEAVGIEG